MKVTLPSLICILLLGGAISATRLGQTPIRVPPDTLPAKIDIAAIPLGFKDKRPVPKDNPLSQEAVDLGRKLFFDPILSQDNTVACASCHDPSHGFAAPQPLAIGIQGRKNKRNAPSLLNRAYGTSFFWDGREITLEAQALKPIEDPAEMGATVAEVVKRLGNHPDYPARFKAAFADPVSAANLAKALASFERTLLMGNTKIDLFNAGEVGHLNPDERHGMWLWESKGRCWRCHSGPNFTDEQFHNTGVSWGKQPLDLGRFEITKKEGDRGKFKTPTLRGVGLTAPYMHDGSIATLEEVVEYYNQGGQANPRLDPQMRPLGLSKSEVQSLVAFLRALSEGDGPMGTFNTRK